MDTKFFDVLIDKLHNWGVMLIDMIPNFILALLVIAAFGIASRFIRKGFVSLLLKTYRNEEMTKILGRIIQIAVIITGTMAALSILHLDKTVTSVLAGAGILGLALSFAFQDLAANFVSGFFMAAKKPFEIGDVIEVKDLTGTVTNIALRNTEIITLDGNEVVVPNRYLFENPLTNYYRTKTRRVNIKVGVSYAEGLDFVEEITRKAISTVPGLLEHREVLIIFREFGDSSVNFDVYYWIPYETYAEYLKGISHGVKAIKKAYDENGITIPFPIRTLDFGIKGGEKLNEVIPLQNPQNSSSKE